MYNMGRVLSLSLPGISRPDVRHALGGARKRLGGRVYRFLGDCVSQASTGFRFSPTVSDNYDKTSQQQYLCCSSKDMWTDLFAHQRHS